MSDLVSKADINRCMMTFELPDYDCLYSELPKLVEFAKQLGDNHHCWHKYEHELCFEQGGQPLHAWLILAVLKPGSTPTTTNTITSSSSGGMDRDGSGGGTVHHCLAWMAPEQPYRERPPVLIEFDGQVLHICDSKLPLKPSSVADLSAKLPMFTIVTDSQRCSEESDQRMTLTPKLLQADTDNNGATKPRAPPVEAPRTVGVAVVVAGVVVVAVVVAVAVVAALCFILHHLRASFLSQLAAALE